LLAERINNFSFVTYEKKDRLRITNYKNFAASNSAGRINR